MFLYVKFICFELQILVREEIESLLEDKDDNLKNISSFNSDKEGKNTQLSQSLCTNMTFSTKTIFKQIIHFKNSFCFVVSLIPRGQSTKKTIL
jgi:hypothetical protein